MMRNMAASAPSVVAVVPLDPARTEEAVRVLADAFVGNPVHVAVFGADRLDANVAFFRAALSMMKGTKWVALDRGRIVGMTHWVESPRCQFTTAEKLRTAAALLRGISVQGTLRAGAWLSTWARLDPAEAHIHLGPIGVAPSAQGHGVGRALMRPYCNELDDRQLAGYLETDRSSNVTFYGRFGFEVVATASVHGVPNYFMSRAPR